MAIPPGSNTIEDIFLNHWGTEPLLDEDDICTNQSCKATKQRTKEIQLIRWPQVMTIQLKRWEVISYVPFWREKVDAHIGFDLVWPAAHNRPPYQLRSVVVHSGAADAGHYTAYVRAQDESWYFATIARSLAK